MPFYLPNYSIIDGVTDDIEMHCFTNIITDGLMDNPSVMTLSGMVLFYSDLMTVMRAFEC